VEYGSGKSTLWFARQVAALTSVEHDPAWFARISTAITEGGLGNVTYLLIQAIETAKDDAKSKYIRVVERFPLESLDFVLVDGILRAECAIAALGHLRQGGILILDNSNWYLPSNSHAPGSRKTEDGPASPRWAEFIRLTEEWRKVRTSDGVTDTTFFFKPMFH